MTIPEPLDPDAAPDRPAQSPAPDEGTPDEGVPGSEPPDQHTPGPGRSRTEDLADLAADGRPLADTQAFESDGL
ncbi:hypothetical protein [Cellulomonas timonensis]|uniref:hypothetical protein n=1 Tax=Cellulomonas timonensis TaxID=1689271 RepID=UPI00082D9B73|nr:hypothetical protein [Cellulomonas timonensis]